MKHSQPERHAAQGRPSPSAQQLYATAVAAQQRGDLNHAAECFASLLQQDPDNAQLLHQLGVVEMLRGQPAAAEDLLRRSLTVNPRDAAAHLNLGVALRDQKHYKEALACYDAALALQPDFAEVYVARGVALNDSGEPKAAVESYNRAISLNPNLPAAYFNRGNAQRALLQHHAAIASYNRAIELKPDLADAHGNKANALLDLKQYKAALLSLGTALNLNPKKAKYYLMRANISKGLELFGHVVADLDQVLKLEPDNRDAYINRAEVNQRFERHAEAIADYKKALELGGKDGMVEGSLIAIYNNICQWDEHAALRQVILEKTAAGERVVQPLTLLALSDDPALQQKCAQVFLGNPEPAQTPSFVAKPKAGKKIRVAYYSTDFHEHPVMHLMEKVFQLHDRERFEFTGFYLGQNVKDELNKKARGRFDRFIHVNGFDADTLVELSTDYAIDIAIDMNGFTGESKTSVFYKRCAPVQINFLGYPGTSGLSSMDYLIGDKFIIHPENRGSFSENIIYLPDCYQPNNDEKAVSEKNFERAEFGLPDDHFVFCCSNNINKITPERFASWMRILSQVPKSSLWLFTEKTLIQENLRKQAAAAGIDPARLVFAKRMPVLADHLARYKLADLFLDTFPYNAHTTASDALWGGLPVLTHSGKSYVSRVAGSLLSTLGLPELITDSEQNYERLAVDLAVAPERLQALKSKLAERRLASPLFNSERFTRKLEAAFVAAHERRLAGQAPADIHIE